MALKTWTIELRTDFNDKAKDKLAEQALRRMAHEALATMMLLSDGRKPDIALTTSDMFVGAEDLLLFDPDSGDAIGA